MPKRVYRDAYASVGFHAAWLDPLYVTKALRLPPDETFRRGEPRLMRASNGRVIEHAPYDHGFWGMSSKEWVDSPRVSTHIEWILSELKPSADEVRNLADMVETARILCYSSGTTEAPQSYPKALDERASALGLFIEIDHYFFEE